MLSFIGGIFGGGSNSSSSMQANAPEPPWVVHNMTQADQANATGLECAICQDNFLSGQKITYHKINNKDYCRPLQHLHCLQNWVDQGTHNSDKCITCKRPHVIPQPHAKSSDTVTQIFKDFRMESRDQELSDRQRNLADREQQENIRIAAEKAALDAEKKRIEEEKAQVQKMNEAARATQAEIHAAIAQQLAAAQKQLEEERAKVQTALKAAEEEKEKLAAEKKRLEEEKAKISPPQTPATSPSVSPAPSREISPQTAVQASSQSSNDAPPLFQEDGGFIKSFIEIALQYNYIMPAKNKILEYGFVPLFERKMKEVKGNRTEILEALIATIKSQYPNIPEEEFSRLRRFTETFFTPITPSFSENVERREEHKEATRPPQSNSSAMPTPTPIPVVAPSSRTPASKPVASTQPTPTRLQLTSQDKKYIEDMKELQKLIPSNPNVELSYSKIISAITILLLENPRDNKAIIEAAAKLLCSRFKDADGLTQDAMFEYEKNQLEAALEQRNIQMASLINFVKETKGTLHTNQASLEYTVLGEAFYQVYLSDTNPNRNEIKEAIIGSRYCSSLLDSSKTGSDNYLALAFCKQVLENLEVELQTRITCANWGNMLDDIAAREKLKGKQPGTYLFRASQSIEKGKVLHYVDRSGIVQTYSLYPVKSGQPGETCVVEVNPKDKTSNYKGIIPKIEDIFEFEPIKGNLKFPLRG